MSQTTTVGCRTNYDVGYGKPPVHSRFTKGQSGNPSGRGQSRMRLLERAKELTLAEAYRKVTIREGETVTRLPAVQAVMRSQIKLAAKGNGPAQRAVIKAVQDLEGEHETRSEALVDSWMEYKVDTRRRIEERQRQGLPIDDIKPHPDDVLVDVEARCVWVSQDMWPDDATRIRKLGLGNRARAGRALPEPADDHGPRSIAESIGVSLGPVLKALDYEAQDAVLDALNEAKEALSVGRKSDRPSEPNPAVPAPPWQPDRCGPQESQSPKRDRTTIELADILERLAPEYHAPLREAITDEKRALAGLLEGVPWPRPSYAGIHAEKAAALIRTCTGERLERLAASAKQPNRERVPQSRRAFQAGETPRAVQRPTSRPEPARSHSGRGQQRTPHFRECSNAGR